MAQVRITLNQRTYRLDCEEPARPRFDEIAKIVQQKAASVIEEFGNIGQDQVLLMSALKIADELVDARAQNADGGANVDAAANAGADTVAEAGEEGPQQTPASDDAANSNEAVDTDEAAKKT